MGIHVDARRSFAALRRGVSEVGRALEEESQNADDNASQVVISTRPWAGAVYVIAVNAGDSATDVTINVPSLQARTLTVLGESRQIDSDGGSFIDHFDPLDVHIYIAA
jgi:hypothetical protein